MATPEPDFLREMACLLGAMTEARLDEAGRRRLADLVGREPEARRLYMDYCQMHALLRSAHGVLTALEPPDHRRRAVRFAAAIAALASAAAVLFVTLWVVRPTGGLQPAIASVQGDVHIVRDGQRIPADTGGRIRPGERILTGPNGSANLRVADGTTIRVDGSTEVSITQDEDSRQVQLKVGVMHCDVTKQPPGRPVVFLTPHAELTVLGTAFELLAAPVESRVRVIRGQVRWTAGGRSVEAATSEVCTADMQGVQAWQPVCNLDFGALQNVPPQMETVYCDTSSLHTVKQNIVPAPRGLCLEDGGLRFAESRPMFGEHGLLVSRWAEDVGSDAAIEVEVSAGAKWSLGIAVDGDSFQGYRVIFAAPDYPFGCTIDSLYPAGQTLLAKDPRPLSYERSHVLRVEKYGRRIRVWVDREIRIDTEVSHALASGRRKTFAISNFGESPVIRSLRVWKAAH